MAEEAIILLAEDREDDVLLIRKAFKKAFLSNPLYDVRDGVEAIDYLEGVGRFANRQEFPLPDLLLLDLKMPKVDGFEVLQWLRKQSGFSSLRVVVLTSSDHINDVNRAYQLGANSFMVKPLDFENFLELSRFMSSYWLQLSKAPQIARPPLGTPKPLGEL